ncbi:hypothetical protein [Catenulispora pinisilvae]|uniref:hypothetical protein n=1 Tax=Catenulispora pinisilvae TaxID=2705253 RepID=UPI0018914E43|nr:hypothetical protein [Catenulispora pinisilvae]
MYGATVLPNSTLDRQRLLLRWGRTTRLQGIDLQPFDEIYLGQWRSRRLVADVQATPDAAHELLISLAPRAGRPMADDELGANLDTWFTVCRRQTRRRARSRLQWVVAWSLSWI